MTLYGLRLLVALLTFSFGVAATWLFSSKPAPASVETYRVTTVAIEVPDPSMQMPTRFCANRRTARCIQGGVLNGKAISKPVPVYPPATREERVSGTVAVHIVVDECGLVESAEAMSGPELLREAAEDAARAARFSPTRLSGEPVKVSGTITYNFVLQ
ncbi:MAG: TonB family protein [Acidobacteria bacterium]|nr:TonB family protein [Acidobacteriota bacterium]